ncbi:ElyC/SanA/YdcF family protein [Propionimicrobium sp. PCR01-08-3]|uniref:SanA/YdcF family protein n=1 Tax=Propionimicrobium sp. PCR01-08-3 TaxID=3052086 RepID=UPI00255CC886|nr:ElyC/SanA/YdcF family protein [Propionimicrobium sp. PCR01-08-3]WIY82797.1 ElyC/SanA/YdcF family protein [Propionimicrobium sp. PCR01-08-3]
MRILGRALVALLILALLVVGGPWAAVQVMSIDRTWTDADEAPARDVGLVMGAATIGGLSPSGYLQARLDVALELWKQGKITVFIVTGSTSDNEPAVMRDYLVQNGVDPLDVIEDEGGLSSYSSCVRAKEVFGVDQLTVISQSYHVPRTVATCRMVGVDAIGVGDDEREDNDALRSYKRRELAANMKMIYDVLTKTDVGTLTYDPSVQDALARHR